MEDFRIDTEAADLIVQTYQKINMLKRLLSGVPYAELKELIECGTTLSEMMNSAIGETTKEGLETKLSALSAQLKSFSFLSAAFQSMQQNQEITYLFNQLMADISSLQLKINTEK